MQKKTKVLRPSEEGLFILRDSFVTPPQYNEKKGFTLIELTVVLAILAIIAAILVPTFLITTDRARLRGDIQTARIIQNAIELHQVERGGLPEGATIEARIETLIGAGYLPRRTIRPQTQDAHWEFNVLYGVRVNIRANDSEALIRAVQNLSEDERRFVIH